MKKINLFDPMPEKVCLVGLGASALDFMQHMVAQELKLEFDQIWTLNMGCRIFRHDVLWVMDDLRMQAKNYPFYGQFLARHDRPIITSQDYPEFPMSVRYPIEKVVDAVGDDLFTNTVCYVIAFAMVGGVKDLTLYGCDFFYPNIDVREEGGGNASYFLGLARHFGMDFHIPQASTLLSSYLAREGNDGHLHRTLYGYAKQPLFATGGLESGPRQPTTRSRSAQVRESEGDGLGAVEGSEPLPQVKPRRKPAALHSEGQSVPGAVRGSPVRKAAGVVLAKSVPVLPAGPDGGWMDAPPTDINRKPAASSQQDSASGKAKRKMAVP